MIPDQRGVIAIGAERVDDWNRASKVARLQLPEPGAPLDHPALYDAVVVCARPECWTFNRIEKIKAGLRVIEYAQA